MSSGRVWYWPSAMPSRASPFSSSSVRSIPGMDSATPSLWAMVAVSVGPFFRSRCRRMNGVFSDCLSASEIGHTPHDAPPALYMVTLPDCTGADEYWADSGMSWSSAAARAKILTVEPVCKPELA